ncbi:PAC2 family-domain-containing protein [Collybia nuda]|uniref:Proteasome assembly chaperone 2 n=1 Tax=Collybia nuda TaxID=64659 RepID=A0A9P5YIF1_9AGAR|nr:PAC2 family-domain-containing protein [Collybia nuda]
MDTFIYPALNSSELFGKTLIVPIVSAANVSQLAVDLLITSSSLVRLAIFDSEFFVPVAGGREDGIDGITAPLELYGKSGTNLLIIQQRSPVLKSRKSKFVASLLQFIQESGFGCVLFLSGVELTNRMDSQMFTPTYQVQLQRGPGLHGTILNTLNSLPIPMFQSPRSDGEHGDINIPSIPGGGLSRRILSSLPDTWSTPTASLLHFVLEGDNRADARLFAGVVAKVVCLDSLIEEWKSPSSWKLGLFGAPHDYTLYG